MIPPCEAFDHPIFSVAPMIDWTDRHCRFFLRLLSKKAFLYTEMVTTGAILHGDPHRHLFFNPSENPVGLQLGGSDPKALAECAKRGQDYGYNEINLNVGCPSERVQNGKFGACLMKEPELVADCISAMQAAVTIPVTVKTRIGVDERDHYDDLHHFIKTVSHAGCKTFIIHARKAWLKGLSPKENREVPPLRYDIVKQLIRDFSGLNFVLNGGILTLEDAQRYLESFSGVMLGRAIMNNPYLLANVDNLFYGTQTEILSREDALNDYLVYAKEEHASGVPLSILARPIMGLYQGCPGAKAWRRNLMSFLQVALRFDK